MQLLHALLEAGGARSVITDDIEAARWRKVLWLAHCATWNASVNTDIFTGTQSSPHCVLPLVVPSLASLLRTSSQLHSP